MFVIERMDKKEGLIYLIKEAGKLKRVKHRSIMAAIQAGEPVIVEKESEKKGIVKCIVL